MKLICNKKLYALLYTYYKLFTLKYKIMKIRMIKIMPQNGVSIRKCTHIIYSKIRIIDVLLDSALISRIIINVVDLI